MEDNLIFFFGTLVAVYREREKITELVLVGISWGLRTFVDTWQQDGSVLKKLFPNMVSFFAFVNSEGQYVESDETNFSV